MPRRPPGVRARALGAELREFRAAAKLSTRAVAERLGWAYSTINRIETGKRKTTTDEVSALLVVYNVKGDERDRLIELAREVDQPGWWETGHPSVQKQLTALIGFEATATGIVDFAPVLVPGLLQAPEYTRALLISMGMADSLAETMVSMRMGRQAILSKPDPPEYLAIVDEAVLRRPIGGPRVMADQIHRMLKEMTRPNVTVQAIPLRVGGHTGLDGPYVVLSYAKSRTIVHLEHKRSGIFVDEPDDIGPFLEATATLQRIALDPIATGDFLTALAAEYEQQQE
jgi:transcriptional regulator with XRE-family HTH domain